MSSISKILISQSAPMDIAPYNELKEKYGVSIDFKPFFKVVPLDSKEFRMQRINILDYTAIVLSARSTIDAFFTVCEEMRVKVPDTMKYFCTTEAVAMYLQKHIIFRKRKIFYGTGTPDSVMEAIGTKHKGEKFLIATSDIGHNDALLALFNKAGIDHTAAVFVKSVSQDLKDYDPRTYDIAVVNNPSDIKSLSDNFHDFTPGNLKFVTYGKKIAAAMDEAGLPVLYKAPTPEAPSIAKALDICLRSAQ